MQSVQQHPRHLFLNAWPRFKNSRNSWQASSPDDPAGYAVRGKAVMHKEQEKWSSCSRFPHKKKISHPELRKSLTLVLQFTHPSIPSMSPDISWRLRAEQHFQPACCQAESVCPNTSLETLIICLPWTLQQALCGLSFQLLQLREEPMTWV